MFFRESIGTCCEDHMKHTDTPCGQNVVFMNVKTGDTCSKIGALKDYVTIFLAVCIHYNNEFLSDQAVSHLPVPLCHINSAGH
jgi:hypothetical protein